MLLSDAAVILYVVNAAEAKLCNTINMSASVSSVASFNNIFGQFTNYYGECLCFVWECVYLFGIEYLFLIGGVQFLYLCCLEYLSEKNKSPEHVHVNIVWFMDPDVNIAKLNIQNTS